MTKRITSIKPVHIAGVISTSLVNVDGVDYDKNSEVVSIFKDRSQAPAITTLVNAAAYLESLEEGQESVVELAMKDSVPVELLRKIFSTDLGPVEKDGIPVIESHHFDFDGQPFTVHRPLRVADAAIHGVNGTVGVTASETGEFVPQAPANVTAPPAPSGDRAAILEKFVPELRQRIKTSVEAYVGERELEINTGIRQVIEELVNEVLRGHAENKELMEAIGEPLPVFATWAYRAYSDINRANIVAARRTGGDECVTKGGAAREMARRKAMDSQAMLVAIGGLSLTSPGFANLLPMIDADSVADPFVLNGAIYDAVAQAAAYMYVKYTVGGDISALRELEAGIANLRETRFSVWFEGFTNEVALRKLLSGHLDKCLDGAHGCGFTLRTHARSVLGDALPFTELFMTRWTKLIENLTPSARHDLFYGSEAINNLVFLNGLRTTVLAPAETTTYGVALAAVNSEVIAKLWKRQYPNNGAKTLMQSLGDFAQANRDDLDVAFDDTITAYIANTFPSFAEFTVDEQAALNDLESKLKALSKLPE